MTRVFYILLLLLPLFTTAQTGEMRVYTVAGSLTATALGDDGAATAASLDATEGVWLDGLGDIYICDANHNRIRKVFAATGAITTIAGSGIAGYSGDGALATDAQIKYPYGIYVDNSCNVYFTDGSANNRVRRIDMTTGLIYTFAGGGLLLGDGGLATSAQLTNACNVYGDNSGNIYIGEIGRIRKINSSGIISTIAGNGTPGLSGDGGGATDAQIHYPSGMLIDALGNLFFADRANSRIRKINMGSGIITTVAGSTDGFSGDGGAATNAQLSGPISFTIDNVGNIVIGDNQNNLIRRVDHSTGIINTIAGVGSTIVGNTAEGVPATAADIHPEFLYLDISGNIYYSNYGSEIRKIVNYNPGLATAVDRCGTTNVPAINVSNVPSLFPNPTNDLLNINNIKTQSYYRLLSIVGAAVQQGVLKEGNNNISIQSLPTGMYLLEITDAERRKTITKAFKQ